MDAITPQDGTDPFVAARQNFWAPGTAERVPRTCGALTAFLNAEYLAPHHEEPFHLPADPLDRKTASLRRALRARAVIAPEDLLVAALSSDQRLRSTVAEAWPATLHHYGSARVRRALRDEIPRCTDPLTLACLIDLATATRLAVLNAAEWADMAARKPLQGRSARIALWRHLAGHPTLRQTLPMPDTAADAYEHLLLTVARGGNPFEPPDLPQKDGLLVVQSMLLGEIDSPGEGTSGGLGVFLAGLGDALARTRGIDAVITLVTKNVCELQEEPTLLRGRGAGHWTLGLPIDPDDNAAPGPGGRGRYALSWWTSTLVAGLGRRPDLVHVRYADDGSLAIAEAARALGARLVFTATPDPHRRIGERHAGRTVTGTAETEELRDDLHRVFAADMLVDRADEVIGIPGRGGTAELIRYFPQLAASKGGEGPSTPPEGITAYLPADDETLRQKRLLEGLFAPGLPWAIDPTVRDLPVLLTVGRLHPLKQQHVLVRAWIESGLHLRSTLVVVGGSARPETRDPAEREVRAAIADLIAAHPDSAARLALVPAMPNAEVRCLERVLAHSGSTGQALYVCPSVKEEFGIAVLEAMDAGLPVAGTDRGGIPHYLQDMVNGVLLDTSSSKTLAEGVERLMALAPDDVDAMTRRARATVRARYSIDAAASAFAAIYAGRRNHSAAARSSSAKGRSSLA
ncbi:MULTISPECIES: glycosyltransferase [unclassified Streptomyces]|uniref:glycosyltransferase n=1 Tax=unclassified Streptomyces TaxID=2593676 RepID=UPI00365DFA00